VDARCYAIRDAKQVSSCCENLRTSFPNIPNSVFSYFDAFHNSVLESEIKCGKCGHVSKTLGNNERHLSIPIKVPDLVGRHLQLLVKAYMDEVIQGYRCENEKCKHVSDKHRIQKIAYAPDVLLIQLKRFNFRGQKDSSKVQYGNRLDLSPHTGNTSLGPLLYDLTAVISHSGSTSFGHYHCIAKTDDFWADFDDLNRTPSNIRQALNPSLIDRDWTPYLLFYERNKASIPPI
jgi:ubiquitin C-terminal hydrolase